MWEKVELLKDHTDFLPRVRGFFGLGQICSPWVYICPCSGISSRFMHRISVDFPEPDGPQITSASPIGNFQRNVLQRVEISIEFMDAVQLDGGR